MITIKKNEIPNEIRKGSIILYGAGFAGRQCRKILKEQSLNVDFFVDDDKTKWGKRLKTFWYIHIMN